jgi:hypothetical protein
MYPSEKSMARPEVKAFMEFAVQNQDRIATAAKIVPVTSAQAGEAAAELKKAEAGAGA